MGIFLQEDTQASFNLETLVIPNYVILAVTYLSTGLFPLHLLAEVDTCANV